MTIAIGLAVAMTVGAGINAKTALATTGGYLAPSTLSMTSGQFPYTVSGTGSEGSITMYGTSNSSYGLTIPTTSQITTTAGYNGPANISTITDGGPTVTPPPTFYDPTTLDLTQVNSMTTPFSDTSNTGNVTVTGNVMSNVFKVGSGSTMLGAVPGELVFTYQFNVTGVTSNDNSGINYAEVSYFNQPNGTFYQLGSGINYNSSTGQYINLGPSLSGTLTPLTSANLTGQVAYSANGTVESLNYTSNAYIGVGFVSPQFFVASNALYYGLGQMTLQGSGTTSVADVFVPNTPEPATLVLFGTGLAFLGFIALRRKENILNI